MTGMADEIIIAHCCWNCAKREDCESKYPKMERYPPQKRGCTDQWELRKPIFKIDPTWKPRLTPTKSHYTIDEGDEKCQDV